jgi:hypothetical protein
VIVGLVLLLTLAGCQAGRSPDVSPATETVMDIHQLLSEVRESIADAKDQSLTSSGRVAAWKKVREKVNAALGQEAVLRLPAEELDRLWSPDYRVWLQTFDAQETGLRAVAIHPEPTLEIPGGNELVLAWRDATGIRTQSLRLGKITLVQNVAVLQEGKDLVLAVMGDVKQNQEPAAASRLEVYQLAADGWRPTTRIGQVERVGYLVPIVEDGGAAVTVSVDTQVRAQRTAGVAYDPPGSFRFCEGPKQAWLAGWNCLGLEWKAGMLSPTGLAVYGPEKQDPVVNVLDMEAKPVTPELNSEKATSVVASLGGGKPTQVEVLWSDGGEAMVLIDRSRRLLLRKTGEAWTPVDWETSPGTWAKDGAALRLSECDDMVAGVRLGQTESEVLKRLGLPDQRSVSGSTHSWRYKDLGLTLRFSLLEGRVQLLILEQGAGATRRGFKAMEPVEEIKIRYGEPNTDLLRFGILRVQSPELPFEVRFRYGASKQIERVEVGDFSGGN